MQACSATPITITISRTSAWSTAGLKARIMWAAWSAAPIPRSETAMWSTPPSRAAAIVSAACWVTTAARFLTVTPMPTSWLAISAATMAPLIAQVQHTIPYSGVGHHPLWWALSLGACLGGNMTIIGAAANVIVSESSAAAGHPIKFMEYLKYGVVVTFISLVISTGYVWLKYLA